MNNCSVANGPIQDVGSRGFALYEIFVLSSLLLCGFPSFFFLLLLAERRIVWNCTYVMNTFSSLHSRPTPVFIVRDVSVLLMAFYGDAVRSLCLYDIYLSRLVP